MLAHDPLTVFSADGSLPGWTAGNRRCRSAPARAGRSGLDQVPASAPIVIYVRGVEGTRDRFVAMMEKALPDVLKMFQGHMDDALKNGIEGRKLRGLVKDGPIFMAFTELPKPGQGGNGPPKMVIIAAVSNYKEFRDNLLTDDERKNIKVNGNGVEAVQIKNEMTYFVDRKGYAIVTPNEDVASSFTKKQPGLDGKLSKEQATKLLAADVGYYVNVDTLSKDYAEQIKELRQALEGCARPDRRAQRRRGRRKRLRWSSVPSVLSSRPFRTARACC